MTTQDAQPVYVQISALLAGEIGAGRLLPGDKIATERDMAKDLGVSVGTLRKALADLEGKGLLERRQGSGNYISSSKRLDPNYALFRIELLSGGGHPSAVVLDVAKLPKPQGAHNFGASDHAHRIRRVRYLDFVPVALEEIWLDASFADHIAADDLSDSLYLYYKDKLGLWITRAEDRVSLANAPDWTPTNFDKPTGAPCGFVERVAWSQKNLPVEYSRTWYDPDKARYVARIK